MHSAPHLGYATHPSRLPLSLPLLHSDPSSRLPSSQASFEKTEGRFEPLETQYRLLEKFEVSVKESELNKLAGLRGEWQNYRRLLTEVAVRLQKAKADFKDDLLQSLTDFNSQVAATRQEFLRNAPFDADYSSEKAKSLIAEYKGQVAAVRTRETEMRAGLDIFAIEPPVNKETGQTEKDIELLEQVKPPRRPRPLRARDHRLAPHHAPRRAPRHAPRHGTAPRTAPSTALVVTAAHPRGGRRCGACLTSGTTR